jgi:hypothetical protein
MSGFTPKQIAEQKLKAFSIGAMGKTTKMSRFVMSSVTDPDPDPRVFGPPGSGSISQRYGSFYH